MKSFLAGFHLIIGAALCIVGIITLQDYWKTPALTLLTGGGCAITIGIGILAKKRWVRWFVGLLLLVASLIAVFLLVGSMIWPESIGRIIFLIYGLFLLVELSTWHLIRRITICSNQADTIK
jgi:hypothetical protein